ncbi:putative F-box domain-containing protein [Helianthus anomalus]
MHIPFHSLVDLPFELILFQILIKIDTKSIHRFKLVSKLWRDGLSSSEFSLKRGCYVEDYLEMLQKQGSFITSSVLLELWPRQLIELYTFDDHQFSKTNANVYEEVVIIENGQRTVYQVYDDDK